MEKVVLLYFLCYVAACLADDKDPCDATSNTQVLPFMTQRVINYKLNGDENPICDKYIDTHVWYKMPGFVISDTKDPCGTSTNWYIKGPFNPKENTEEDVTFCRNDEPACDSFETGKVKKCDDKNYVFKLKQTYSCPGAYCIKPLPGVPVEKTDSIIAELPQSFSPASDKYNLKEERPPDISDIHPVIVTDIEMIDDRRGEHIHFCDFKPIADKDVWYIVEWSLSTGQSLARHLFTAPDTQYTDERTFRRNTCLREEKLKTNGGVITMGYRIACVVTAKRNPASAVSSMARSSSSKYCGIEIVTKETILLKNVEEKPFQIRLTVPFACEKGKPNCNLDVDMYLPDNVDDAKCMLSDLNHVDKMSLPCGIQFTNDDVGKIKTLTVQSVLGTVNDNRDREFEVLLRVRFFSSHRLMSKYYLDPVKVQTSINTQKVVGKQCYAVCDPHMMTFDGARYENQNPGFQVMYRNKLKNVEVQIKTDKCTNYQEGRHGPWCVVGVATRAGQDIFVADLSENFIDFKTCGNKILEEKVTRKGQSYTIYLPTGAEVRLEHTWERFYNVYITPSMEDWQHTEGLCGKFDGNRNNDNVDFPYPCNDKEKCWRVTDNENLFKATPHNVGQFNAWSEDVQLCTCKTDPKDANAQYNQGLDTHVVCSASSKKVCTDDAIHSKDDSICSTNNRGKRDIHSTTETDFDHQHEVDRSISEFAAMRLRRSTYSVTYNETTARNACSKAMNTSVVQMCSNLPGLDISSSFDNCVLDTMFSNSLEWAQVHIESIKASCMKHVEFNRPIPPEITAQLKVPSLNETNNETIFDNVTTTSTITPTTLSAQTIFTADFLTELKEKSCTNDCSGNGQCLKGQCRCNSGFFNIDCSLNIDEAPEVVGIPDRGKCDIRERQCAKTSVLGRKFVENKALTCRSKSFKVEKNNVLSNWSVTTSPARLKSFVEVVCTLPESKKKRSVNGFPDEDHLASGYRMSVSNNGEQFSKEDTLIIFDSTCVNCNKRQGIITCSANPGFCMQGGRCFNPGDMYGCYTCASTSNGDTAWTSGRDCEQLIPPVTDEPSKLTIIGVAVGSVVLIIGVVSVAMILCLSKKRARKRRVSINAVYDTPVIDSNSKTTWRQGEKNMK